MLRLYNDKEKVVFVPETFGEYYVSICDLKVRDKTGKVLNVELGVKGEPTVKLNWYRGNILYPVKEVVAHCFKRIHLEVRFWSELKVEVVDGNEENVHPSNLIWRFPKALGASEFNGFGFIPGFSRYMINKAGVVFDLKRKRFVKARVSRDYYTYLLIQDVSGKRVNAPRHRLLCMVFKEYPLRLDEMEINHINGVRGDDDLDNLEWCTGSENRQHAIESYLTPVNKPVVMEHIVTGEIIELPTLKKLCETIGIERRQILPHLRSKKGVYLHHPFEVRFKFEEHKEPNSHSRSKVIARNIVTKEIVEFPSIVDCIKYTGLSEHTVKGRLDKNPNSIYEDFWQFKRKSDETEWEEVSDPEKELLSNSWSKVVLVKDLISNEVTEHPTQRQAAEKMGISESGLHQILSDPRQPIVTSDSSGRSYLVQRKSQFKGWREVTDLKRSLSLDAPGRAVVVVDTVTGEERLFDNCKSCADFYNLNTTTLNWRLKKNGTKAYPPGLIFKYA